MRWASALLLGCVGLAACDFNISGVGDGSVSGADLAVVADLGPSPDLAGGCSSCPAGCDTTVTPPRCQHLVPTGPVVSSDFRQAGVTAQSIGSNIVINTDTGAIAGGMIRAAGSGVVAGVGFRVAAQTSGPSVGVFSVAGLTVAKTATITFTGANAFALASSGPLTLAGTIDAACHDAGAGQLAAGPGGFAGGTSLAASGGGPGGGGAGASGAGMPASGGGGGGYGDIGGKGAAGMGLSTTAGGGITGDLTAATFVLVGGSGGGAGGAGQPGSGGLGGSGGGAVQLSIDGDIMIGGIINVGGCGGAGSALGGGGGGGAGGAIVLEGAHIALANGSVLAANGGGGGGGASAGPAGAGAPGGASVMPAAGGNGTGAGGNGGNGGASNGKPGLHFIQGVDAQLLMGPMKTIGGGGGAGCGRIELRSLNRIVDDQSTAVTPDLTDTNFAGAHPTSYDFSTFQ